MRVTRCASEAFRVFCGRSGCVLRVLGVKFYLVGCTLLSCSRVGRCYLGFSLTYVTFVGKQCPADVTCSLLISPPLLTPFKCSLQSNQQPPLYKNTILFLYTSQRQNYDKLTILCRLLTIFLFVIVQSLFTVPQLFT